MTSRVVRYDSVKQDPRWAAIPIFILSSSQRSSDARNCYELGADLYIVKPGSFDLYMRLAEAIGKYLCDGRADWLIQRSSNHFPTLTRFGYAAATTQHFPIIRWTRIGSADLVHSRTAESQE
jgi:DNA-binding NarL/FixJ family response regulator